MATRHGQPWRQRYWTGTIVCHRHFPLTLTTQGDMHDHDRHITNTASPKPFCSRSGRAIRWTWSIARWPPERFRSAELDRLVLPRKTLAHRRILGSSTADQSDRLSRLLRMIEHAEETFGDAAKAHAWLRRPTPLLDGETPLDRLDTDFGTRQVEAILGRIAHGLAA